MQIISTSTMPISSCNMCAMLLFVMLLITSSIEAFINIENRPADQEVVEGSRARMICKTSADPLNSSHLHIRWLFNGQQVNVSRAPSSDHKFLQKSEKNRHVLVIRNAQLEDSGRYTCEASLGLDSDQATALLIVKSRPGPPIDLEIDSVHGNRAKLVWLPGPENGGKITEYLLQFNTSEAPDVWYDYFEKIPGERLDYFVDMPPWGTYTFRLIARNDLGLGEASKPTMQSCTTPPDRPDRNPKNVVFLTHKKHYLVVEWTPMHRLEFHGPGFRYHVYWRRKGSLSWENELVADPARGHFEREVKDVYQVYEVQVRAENELGQAHQPPFTYQGRSGEAEPLTIPRDFRRDPSKPLDPHRAHFIWEAVDVSDKIKGEFRGYRLQYWKSSEGRHKMRQMDVSLTADNRNGHPVVRATLMDLPANTPLRAQVAVRNTHYTGLPSLTIDFFTPEGTPSAVRRLITSEVEEEYVVLQWLPPDQPNGRLTGFDIGYQPMDGLSLGEVRDLKPSITDPTKLSARITGLQPASGYRFVLWAKTRAGRGDMATVKVHTKRITGGRSFYTHQLSARSSCPPTLTPSLRHWATLMTSLFTSWLVLRTLMMSPVFH